MTGMGKAFLIAAGKENTPRPQAEAVCNALGKSDYYSNKKGSRSLSEHLHALDAHGGDVR